MSVLEAVMASIRVSQTEMCDGRLDASMVSRSVVSLVEGRPSWLGIVSTAWRSSSLSIVTRSTAAVSVTYVHGGSSVG